MIGTLSKIIWTAAFVTAFFIAPFAAEGSEMGGSGSEPDSYRFEFRFGWSGYPLFADLMFIGWGCCDDIGEYDNGGPIKNAVEGLYGGPMYCTGAVSAEFNWIMKKWLTLSGTFGYNHFWQDKYRNVSGQKAYTAHAGAIYIIPEARFTYLARKYVKLYSSVGLGAVMYHNKSHGQEFSDELSSFLALPCIQMVPIGISAGGKFFGFTEIGLGSLYSGIYAGVGFRF